MRELSFKEIEKIRDRLRERLQEIEKLKHIEELKKELKKTNQKETR